MKKILMRTGLVLALLLVVMGVDAQKVDKRLTNLLEQTQLRRAQGVSPVDMEGVKKTMSVDFNADGTLRSVSAIATLQAGAQCPTEKLQQMGIEVRYVIGDMAVLNVPASQLLALEKIEEFRFVSADQKMQLHNSASRAEMGIDKVSVKESALAEGLPQAYTGKGVVLGIIDKGIDFGHAAFRDEEGRTRIKKAVVYSETTKQLVEYTTQSEILNLTSDSRESAHGSHTSGTAAGSYMENFQQGMAPEADLVLCGLSRELTDANISDCIKRIFDYAESVGKPAVVSISLGNILGLHDGSDIQSKAVVQLTDNGNKKGRIVLTSSSNSAENYQSIIKTMKDEEKDQYGYHVKTVLGAYSLAASPLTNQQVGYNDTYCIYAGDFQNFEILLAIVDLTTGEALPLTEWEGKLIDRNGNVLTYDKYPQPLYEDIPTLAGGNARIYYLSFADPVYLIDKKYRFALAVQASHDGQVIKMMSNGDNAQEHCFDAPHRDGTADFRTLGYTEGNGDFAFSTSICNDATISVGAYVSRISWKNYQDSEYSYPASTLTGKKQEKGEIADFSSYGIDDTGRRLPTIIAPGMGLISATNNYCTTYFKESEPGVVKSDIGNAAPTLVENVSKYNRSNWYHLAQGTSMSCPSAAGAIALWMQANPQLTANEVKEILKETCENDEWTTDVTKIPSGNLVQAGFGKINCLKGLKKITGATGIDVISIDGERRATPATMYSVDAPVYNILGQRVNKSQKGLVIYKGRKYLNR